MKKYIIPILTVLLVLAVTWTAFGQADERARRREEMRQRMQNMSEEERAQFLSRMRQRGSFGRGGFISPEAQEEAIKAIQQQLAKLKAVQITRPEGGFQNLSQEERTKLRENMQNRQKVLQTIIAQVARLQGRRQPAEEGSQFMIINTNDLKPIQEAAKKEKAEETSKLLQSLIAGGTGRGFGGRRPEGQGSQGGQRGTRRQRPEGDRGQGGGRQRNR